MNYTNKKASVSIILFSLLLLIYSFFARSYEPESLTLAAGLIKRGVEVPVNLYEVDFFVFQVNFVLVLLIAFVAIGIGIYTFIYKDDREIKSWTVKISRRYRFLKSKKENTSSGSFDGANTSEKNNFYSFIPTLLALLGFILLAVYVKQLGELNRPLSVFESIVSGFGANFLIIFALLFVVHLGKKLLK